MFHSLKLKIPEIVHKPKKLAFLSYVVHKCVYIPVIEHFSFAKIFHPPDNVACQEDDYTGAPCAGDNKRLL